jgi:hypothetical protein
MVAVAHQVEHRIVAPEVAGSRPVSHPISFARTVADPEHFSRRSAGPDCVRLADSVRAYLSSLLGVAFTLQISSAPKAQKEGGDPCPLSRRLRAGLFGRPWPPVTRLPS